MASHCTRRRTVPPNPVTFSRRRIRVGGSLKMCRTRSKPLLRTSREQGDTVTPSDPNIRPSLPAASIASGYDASIVVRRWLGAWIDFIVLLSFLIVPDYVLGNATYQSTLAVWIGLLAAYFPASEALFGRTLGKFVTRTRVVNASGQRPSLGQVVIRTLFRLIEVNPLLAGGIPAGIAVVASRHKQRLGDMVAGTYVLRERDLRHAASFTADAAEPPPLPAGY